VKAVSRLFIRAALATVVMGMVATVARAMYPLGLVLLVVAAR
jgi:hypothetical protein